MAVGFGIGALVCFLVLAVGNKRMSKNLFFLFGTAGLFLLLLIPVCLLGLPFFTRITASCGTFPWKLCGLAELNLSGKWPELLLSNGMKVTLTGEYAGVLAIAAFAAVSFFHRGYTLFERPVVAACGSFILYLLAVLRVIVTDGLLSAFGESGRFLILTYISRIPYFMAVVFVYYCLLYKYRLFRRKVGDYSL